MSILDKQIPNMETPFEGIGREVQIYELKVNTDYNQLYIGYRIKHTANGEDVTEKMNNTRREWYITNDHTVYKRDFETFQLLVNDKYHTAVEKNQLPSTIENPNYIVDSGEPEFITNPEYVSDEQLAELKPYLEAPAFDYLLGIFKERPALIWVTLELYILENYKDGWFD